MPIEEAKSDPKEMPIPLAMTGVGILLYLAHAMFFGGARGVGAQISYLSLGLVIQVVLGLLTCFIVTKTVGTDYGAVIPAAFKLAAIFILPGAIGLYIPVIGWIVSLVLYWAFIEWLFGLDVMDTIATVVAIWLVAVAAFFLAAVLLSMR